MRGRGQDFFKEFPSKSVKSALNGMKEIAKREKRVEMLCCELWMSSTVFKKYKENTWINFKFFFDGLIFLDETCFKTVD